MERKLTDEQIEMAAIAAHDSYPGLMEWTALSYEQQSMYRKAVILAAPHLQYPPPPVDGELLVAVANEIREYDAASSIQPCHRRFAETVINLVRASVEAEIKSLQEKWNFQCDLIIERDRKLADLSNQLEQERAQHKADLDAMCVTITDEEHRQFAGSDVSVEFFLAERRRKLERKQPSVTDLNQDFYYNSEDSPLPPANVTEADKAQAQRWYGFAFLKQTPEMIEMHAWRISRERQLIDALRRLAQKEGAQ